MFAVDGWKLPNIVPQRAEKKRKIAPSDGVVKPSKKQKPTTKKDPASAAVKKQGKDKSKYTPYGKAKGSSGSNVVPVAKERKVRPRSLTPPPAKPIVQTNSQKRTEKKPLARPPRSERASTPPKLTAAVPPPIFTGPSSSSNLTPLQRKMAAKLSGARFRWINEKLYTSTGSDALSLITSQPDMFEAYHAGFKSQVKDWPSNPIDTYITRLQECVANPQGKKMTVIDLGCGEAELAKRVRKVDPGEKRVKVLSFDLLAANELITACDIAHLPLPDGSVDVALFCLSLMGLDFMSFIKEAFRVVKQGGELWIAEIKSRFNDNEAKSFIEALKKVGFSITSKDDSNKMFIKLDFVRGKEKRQAVDAGEGTDTKKIGALLKPCTYKKR